MKLKDACSLEEKAMTNLYSTLKSRDIILPTKVCLVKAMVFPVVMYGCESWTIRKAEHQRIDAFKLWCWRRLLRVPWTAAEAEAPVLWPHDAKSQLFRKAPGAEQDWRQEEKGTTGDEMVGWHPWLNGHEFEQALGDGDAQGSLACCKELDTTEGLNINMPDEMTERLSRYSLAV